MKPEEIYVGNCKKRSGRTVELTLAIAKCSQAEACATSPQRIATAHKKSSTRRTQRAQREPRNVRFKNRNHNLLRFPLCSLCASVVLCVTLCLCLCLCFFLLSFVPQYSPRYSWFALTAKSRVLNCSALPGRSPSRPRCRMRCRFPSKTVAPVPPPFRRR
jgi:hypothetical protein